MKKIRVSTGIYWVEIPEAELFILCGCPADSVKHLMKSGLITSREKDGKTFESGPNAVLLSDLALQNQRFSNLAEFPVLQMLYRQGMAIPGHPNNTGVKPMIIGLEEQVKSQAEYIYLGNYGLASLEEIMAAGIPENEAKDILRMKLHFAFGKMSRTEELLDLKIVLDKPLELKNGVFISRTGSNLYEFSYKGERTTVNLNLEGKEEYEAPYRLGTYNLIREYFSVVYFGEGDGWNVQEPCMSSIITFQGKIYLIDAGPNIMHSLTALGISANDIEGIFQTHAHDDHFNGLPILLRSDHKLKYYSTALVRATVTKKLCSLMCIKEQSFGNYFEIHDLNLDTWNNIDGLEVMPVLSPHPLETTILFFRTLWNEGYMSYAHLADICSLELLEKAVTGDKLKNGVSRDFFNKVKTAYFTPADIKKIDIGGGMIHGNAADFAADGSKKIIFSHSSGPLTDEQKELGSSASFGLEDVLIRGEQDYLKPAAMGHFKSLYPSVPQHDLRMLLNCPAVSFNPGTIIIRKGEVNSDMYFILTGLLEFIVSETGIRNYLGSGSMAGELSGLLGTAARGTYRAISRVRAIKISSRMYHEFAVRNDLLSEIKQNVDKRNFLQNTWLFGEMISCPIKNKIAGVMKRTDFERNEVVDFKGASRLFLVESGHLELTADDNPVETIDSGNFFGVEIILFGTRKYFSVRAVEKSRTYAIPGSLIQDIPVVQWKLIETFKKRMRKAGYLASG